jgi:hypothetical protein
MKTMNKMKKLALCAALLTSVAMPAAAQGEIELKGIYLGMPEWDFERITNSRNHVERHQFPYELYLGDFTLANIKPRMMEGTFKDGLLVQWHFVFNHVYFEKMLDVLKMRYDLKCKVGEVQTKGGTEFDHENCIYDFGDTRLALSSRFFDIETASLLVTSATWFDERQQTEQLRSRNDL